MSYTIRADGLNKIILNQTDTVSSVLQNVAIILGTQKGSVPLYREFGLPQDSIDRPIPVAKVILLSQIKEAVEEFEPRAEVVSVTFEQDKHSPGVLIPIVEVNILE